MFKGCCRFVAPACLPLMQSPGCSTADICLHCFGSGTTRFCWPDNSWSGVFQGDQSLTIWPARCFHPCFFTNIH